MTPETDTHNTNKNNIIKSSLRKNLLNDIDGFLEQEGFRKDECIVEGILSLVDLVSDYYEEGKHLYPEVVLTNDLTLFKSIPSRIITIKRDSLTVKGFKNALKLCAPLAVDKWVIFIEINEMDIRFGLLSTEMTETSLSLYRQTHDSEMFPENSTFAYMKCIGQKTVEIRGIKNILYVYLNLDSNQDVIDNSIEKLSRLISSGIGDSGKEKLFLYLEKLIDESLKAGHGNLIGVVEDNKEVIERTARELNDGIYLENPLDIAALVDQEENEKTNESSVRLTAHSSIVRSMLNHDGISLFTTKGRLLGYHLFIKDNHDNSGIVGGARSRAYDAMKKMNLKGCLYKSQDGKIEYHEK